MEANLDLFNSAKVYSPNEIIINLLFRYSSNKKRYTKEKCRKLIFLLQIPSCCRTYLIE